MAQKIPEKDTQVSENTQIAVLDERTIRDRIYVVRGVKVMLDFELAEIYGYTTKAFNQQVKNNATRFDNDFRFQLTQEEVAELSRSKNLTAMQGPGMKGGRTSLPWVFTESGIYMLMTVLKSDLAIQQSKALIRTFRAMKDYIVENQSLISQHDYLRLAMTVSETARDVSEIKTKLVDHEERLNNVIIQLQDTVKKSELSPVLLDFSNEENQTAYIFMDGQPFTADLAYMELYSRASQTIYIIDNYISAKTMHQLQTAKAGVTVTIFSDNIRNMLSASDYQDYMAENPGATIDFYTTQRMTHDRFIVLDYGTEHEQIYHCGASSKDAGKKVCAITEVKEQVFHDAMKGLLQKLFANPVLVLR